MKDNELLILYIMDELSGEERKVVEKKMESDPEFKKEYDKLRNLQTSLNEKKTGVSEDMLNESRMDLIRNLNAEENKRSTWDDFADKIREIFFERYQYALGGAFMLLIGIFAGYLFFSQAPQTPPLISEAQQGINIDEIQNQNVQLNNVRFISDVNSQGEVELRFDAVKPLTVKGSLKDEKIQKMLALAITKADNPGLRMKTLRTINFQQMETEKALIQDASVKKALIQTLKDDPNAGVRREALNTLIKFEPDAEVRSAFLNVLANDENPGLRIAAINALSNMQLNDVSIDNKITEVLNDAKNDENDYVRLRSASLLQEVE